jgi:isoleucyl-tRNA synthetase
MSYPQFPQTLMALEAEILEAWRQEDLFRRTLDATADGEEFVFFEGPPTANGRPGIHHVISRTIKDLVCRFRTMQGRHVTRIAGWDTHGLPVEIEAEKRLGISGKRQIEELGVARFNEVCRDSVFTYKEDWERLSERIGYWLDYSRPYVTFHPEYIESVWAILRRLHDQGLIYRGHRSVPYCPRCGTALSSHEVAQGYEDVLDPSLYSIMPLLRPGDDPAASPGEGEPAFLVWTTTPWTLPSNTALAVHPELTYAEVEWQGRRLILAESRVAALFGEDAQVLRRHPAAELVGRRYRRPFDIVPALDALAGESTWTVVAEDFVNAEDGTGIVHLAPAFGADDYAAGQRHGFPMLQPLDEAGRFQEGVALVGGLFVKDADPVLVEDLRARGLLFRHTLEKHSYPHCWRCRSPLIYMARDSWYIRTTAVKETLIDNNRLVHWHPPEIGAGRFGEWLEGNVDWAISRERFWGTPLPAWVCDAQPAHWELLGSFAELAERAGPLPAGFDPHKPMIDEYSWPCPSCEGTMRRTPEVIDVWFDSGAMPYAQWHYPFENQEQWRRHFPADFICEGVDQTRGWFYSLMAIAGMLGDGPAFRNVVVNDLLLDPEGQKMSKSRGNVVDPWEAIETFGADAIRWYLLTVSQPWVPKRFDPEALSEAARRTFDTLANTYRFFALYASLEDWAPSAEDPPAEQRGVLDRWLLSRLATLTEAVTTDLEAYELTRAARSIGDFVVDDLSNWYVRRSRDRFWGSGLTPDARAAFRTLSDAMVEVARLLAPMTPFLSDWLHRAVTGGWSVHLTPYPEADPALQDPELEAGMDAVRTMARLGRAARETVKVRVRQPLRTLYAVVPRGVPLTEELLEVVRDELNVKELRFLEGAEDLVTFRAVPQFRALGKRFGPRTPRVAEAIRALPGDALAAARKGAALAVELDGERLELEPGDVEIQEDARGDLVVEVGDGLTVALDPALDEELRREGLARELVNRIQRLRREAGFAVSDRIRLLIDGPADILDAARAHRDYIARETLAVDLAVGGEGGGAGYAVARDVDVEDATARIGLAVAAG